MRRKHVPMRSCIGCQQKHPKRELIRIVRTAEGVIEIDTRGKQPGRGAYCCRRLDCWEAAVQPGRLARALKYSVSAEEIARLQGLFQQTYSASQDGLEIEPTRANRVGTG